MSSDFAGGIKYFPKKMREMLKPDNGFSPRH